MKRIPILVASVLMILAWSAGPADAQQDRLLSLEARGAYSFPVGDFSDDVGAESDLGFGAGVVLALSPTFGFYGGWARDVFDCEVCGGDDRIHASGYEAGGIFMAPTQGQSQPWLRAGLIAHRTHIEVGIVDTESDRNLGFQVAAGLDFPLGNSVSISPAVRYNHLTSEFEVLDDNGIDIEAETGIRYLSFDLGLRLHFPMY